MLRERAKKKLAQGPNKRKLLKDEEMKKTIAILLVLVIAMAGVWAVDAIPAAASGDAEIYLSTVVAGKAAFGLTASNATPLTDAAVASITAFNTATSDTVSYATTSMAAFVAGPTVGYLHGFNNYGTAVELEITVDPFTTTDTGLEDASITLTVSPETISIDAATSVRGYFINEALKVTAEQADVDLAPASENYTSTVTITVSTT